jgi:hypothetical protein
MASTNAERQRAWRTRHRGEPQGNKALMAQLAALQARVAQLEVELAAYAIGRSQGTDRTAAGGVSGSEVGARRDWPTPGADRGASAGDRGQGKGMGAQVDRPPLRRRR